MTDYSVKRNYHDQVIVWPDGVEPDGYEKSGRDRNGKPKTWWYTSTGEGYRRTSGIGKAIDSTDNLTIWKQCMTAVGVASHKASMSTIVDLINEFDGDPYYQGDTGGTSSGKNRLKDAAQFAAEVAGASSASALGTEFHRLGELYNKGKTPKIVRDGLVDAFEHYKSAVSPFTFLQQEILIVNDVLRCAGSIDYLVEAPAGLTTPDGVTHDEPLVLSADLKTGRHDPTWPLGVTAQVAGYGTGFRYDQETNTRYPLHERASQDWGLLVHFPLSLPEPRVRFYWLDLRKGLAAARLSLEVEAMRKRFDTKVKANKLVEVVL